MMRKNSKIVTLTVAAAVMLAVTACGSKDKTETTASPETSVEEVTAAAEETAVSGDGSTDAEKQTETAKQTEEAGQDENADEDTDEDTDASVTGEEVNTVSAAGEISSDGVFKAANGRFEIKVPAGWSIDEESNDEYVTFFSPNGDDMLEIVNLSDEAADSMREIYPETAEAYQKMVSRGDGMEILSYDVKTEDNGSQTFRYTTKYSNPSDGIHFLAESGTYDAAKKTYSCATGTVISSDDAVVKQVEEAVKSFKLN